MSKYQLLRRLLLANLSRITLVLVFIFIVLSTYLFTLSYQAFQQNKAVINKTIVNQSLRHDDYLHAYHIGYLLAQEGNIVQANKAFEVAEVSPDPTLRATANFAIGNLHFQNMLKDFGKDRGSRRIVEQVILARESYKDALRLQPALYEARFNLELLDRLSPEKRTQGFKTGDGYTYQITPLLQDGRMHMEGNEIRGLP